MPEISRPKGHEERYNLDNSLMQKFIFVDDANMVKALPENIELCIIHSEFKKIELKAINKLKTEYPEIEFWICSNKFSREYILMANEIGIKTVVSCPIDPKMVEDFFNKKNKLYTKEAITNYDYSSVSNAKIMIVDDNLMNVELLEEILSPFNINISSFLKPKEAAQMILHEKFDLFLLDVMMPEMSGFELATKIKECPHNQNSPIIFISALSDSNNKMKGYNLGSFAYIEKPFDVDMIKSQIFNILKTQKAQEIISSDKEHFLATVAHDLKTPIRAGITALNMLLNENLGQLEQDQHEIIEDILYSTNFMKDMVENILCKNKIENNQINLLKQVYPVRELVENCIEVTKYLLHAKNQKIKVECKIENTLVPFDFLEMKRALHNIISNASQYSPEGSEIDINIFQKENNIGISFQDFGAGIDLANQEDIFQQHISFAKKYKTVGSGLGLYITKKIIEAHGGEIVVESKIGFGTKITVFLPIYDKE